jgi:hypothetical protein
VNRAVVLDTGPLGMVTHRGGVPEVDACKRWLLALAERGVRIGILEIADYEVRRELIRAGKVRGIERLDAPGNVRVPAALHGRDARCRVALGRTFVGAGNPPPTPRRSMRM